MNNVSNYFDDIMFGVQQEILELDPITERQWIQVRDGILFYDQYNVTIPILDELNE